jgi:dipeptidyl aminopeptidase/acylaminoacyl peptidase
VVAPDGRSLITSIGRAQGTIWLHDASGERILATANEAYAPWLSADGRRAYFLEARTSGDSAELRRLDIGSGRSDSLLAGFAFRSYGISADESQVVFSTGHGAASQVWVAPLDRRSPPRLLARAADEAAFGANDEIFFRSIGEHENTLHRIRSDGSGESKVLPGPIVEFRSVAPDGKHVMVDLKTPAGPPGAWLAPVDGGQPVLLREGWWPASWSRDGKSMYIEAGTGERGQRHGRTAIVPVGADGLPSATSGPGASGGALIPYAEDSISVAADPAVYLFQNIEVRHNIYRIPLH